MCKLAIFILCSAFVPCVLAELKFSDCGSEIGKLKNITISECNKDSEACELQIFTDATIELEFELTGRDCIFDVTTDIHGNEITFTLDDPNACSNSGLDCPLKPNKIYKYIKTLPIKIYYPPIDVTVKWALIDVISKKNIVCVIVPVTISFW